MPADKELAGFIVKLYEIFNNNAYKDLCGWGGDGTSIIIYDIIDFTKFVVPNHFKHSNFPSFVRQLNMYDFHKTTQDPNHGEFRHEYFMKGRPDLLNYIKRKPTGPKATATKASAAEVAANRAEPKSQIRSKNTLASKGGNNTSNSSNNILSLIPPEAAPRYLVRGGILGLETPTTTADDMLVFETDDSATNMYFPEKASDDEEDLFEPIDLEFGLGATYDISKPTSSSLALQLPDITDINIKDSLSSNLIYNQNNLKSEDSAFDSSFNHDLTNSPVGVIVTSESELLLKELTFQKLIREQFERRLKVLEQNSEKIMTENQNLRKFAVESCNRQLIMQSKMDKVLKTLYNVFMSKAVGNGSSSGSGGTMLPPITPRTMNKMISDVSDGLFQKAPGSGSSTTSDAGAAMLTGDSLSSTPREMNIDINGQPLAKTHSFDVNFNDICTYLQVENPFSRSNSTSNSVGKELVRKHSLDVDTLTNSHSNTLSNNGVGTELAKRARSDSFEAAAYAISNPPPQLRPQHSLAGYPPPSLPVPDRNDKGSSSSSTGGAPLARMKTIFPASNTIEIPSTLEDGIGFLRKETPYRSASGALPPTTIHDDSAGMTAHGKRKRDGSAAADVGDGGDGSAVDPSVTSEVMNSNDFQFMNQFTKSQYTTLSRIDSLQSTIATFFAPTAASDKGENGNEAADGALPPTSTEKRRSERIKHEI